MTTKMLKSLSRRFTAFALLAALVTTGGIANYQPERAPSTGDTLPRCC